MVAFNDPGYPTPKKRKSFAVLGTTSGVDKAAENADETNALSRGVTALSLWSEDEEKPFFEQVGTRLASAFSFRKSEKLPQTEDAEIETGDAPRHSVRNSSVGGWRSEDESLSLLSTPEERSPEEPRPRSVCTYDCGKVAHGLVRHEMFELGIGLLVLMNAYLLGCQVDYMACTGNAISEVFIIMDLIFCGLFMSEMTLRIGVFGWNFFVGPNWEFNWFDLIMVGLQAVDLLGHMTMAANVQTNVSVVRVLRVLRLARILRVLRAVHLFEELRRIVLSLYQASKTLFWSLVMMFIIVYVWSVFFLQVLVETENYKQVDALDYYFGSLARAILTMSECMLAGVSWDVVVTPLIEHIAPFMGVLFVTYVAISLLVVMNLVTGLFVDTVTSNVREDKDDTLAANIRNMIAKCADDFDGDEDASFITWEAFEANMQSAEIQAFFRSIDVNPADARLLFDLFDPMHVGSVEREDLINGFLRMRGPAKALDLAMLRSELAEMSMILNVMR